jgi:hypothetical protein
MPEEVEDLIPLLRRVERPVTYLLSYAPAATKKMVANFSDLAFFAIPPLPADLQCPIEMRVELGIFSGRLYFPDKEYDLVCKTMNFQVESQTNGVFTKPSDTKQPKLFTKDPIRFMRDWLSIRRHGQEFKHTLMGHLCFGKPARHFFLNAESKRENIRPNGLNTNEIVNGSKLEEGYEDGFGDPELDPTGKLHTDLNIRIKDLR